MPAFWIVEPFDVIKDVCTSMITSHVMGAAASLRLYRGEEAFHGCVIPTITSTTHAAFNALSGQERLELLAGVLATLVRVMQQCGLRNSAPDRHQQGVANKLSRHLLFHRPANDSTRVKVQNDCDVKPAFAGPDVGEVSDPAAIRRVSQKFPIQDVRRDHGTRSLVMGQTPPTRPCLESCHLHQSSNSILAASNTPVPQIPPDSRTSVSSITLSKTLSNACRDRIVLLISLAARSTTPLVESARRNPEQTAHAANWPNRPMPSHKRVLHLGSCAKYPSAFFKISRSIVTFFSSRCSLATSASDGCALLLDRTEGLPSSVLTHLRSRFSWMSSSLAIWATGRPRSRTARTASSLNSWLNVRLPTAHLLVA